MSTRSPAKNRRPIDRSDNDTDAARQPSELPRLKDSKDLQQPYQHRDRDNNIDEELNETYTLPDPKTAKIPHRGDDDQNSASHPFKPRSFEYNKILVQRAQQQSRQLGAESKVQDGKKKMAYRNAGAPSESEVGRLAVTGIPATWGIEAGTPTPALDVYQGGQEQTGAVHVHGSGTVYDGEPAIGRQQQEPTVEATLVTDPPLVTAVPGQDNATVIRQIAEEARKYRRTMWIGAAFAVVAIAGSAAAVSVFVIRNNDDPQAEIVLSQTTQPPTPMPVPLIARCREHAEIAIGSSCELARGGLDPSSIDDGSTGYFFPPSLDPPGPYKMGPHNVTLTIQDNEGNTDSCNTIITVVDALTDWVQVGNHIFRLKGCEVRWSDADTFAKASMLCGRLAHLATLMTEKERDRVRTSLTSLNFKSNDAFWLGGYQPESFDESAGNYDENWMWVNNEGFLDEGFTDWDGGEPNSKNEDCLVMMVNRANQWDDRPCTKAYPYIEEVDLENAETIMIDGCDSGIPDLLDTMSCAYVVSPAIESCSNREDEDYTSCVEGVLASYVNDGSLSVLDGEAVLHCGKMNSQPVARCQDAEVPADVDCSIKSDSLNASDFDGGSSDPDGDVLRLELQTSSDSYDLESSEVTLIVLDGRGGSDTCSAKLRVIANENCNKPPKAYCQNFVTTASGCSIELESLNAADFNNRSSDPDGDELRLKLQPSSGSYEVGLHQVTLVVDDGRGGSDSCKGTLLVLPDADTSTSLSFENHVYQAVVCQADWVTSVLLSESTTRCGRRGHLATITSSEERDVVVGMVRGLDRSDERLWLGGFQPSTVDESDGNYDLNWTWVNNEGLVADIGFDDWDRGEPNSAREDCMIIHGVNRGFRWDDHPCDNKFGFIMEVETNSTTVHVDDCDSGVPDVLIDAESCTYLISGYISACQATPTITTNATIQESTTAHGTAVSNETLQKTTMSSLSNETNTPPSSSSVSSFASCLEPYLDVLVANGTITVQERRSIALCARIPPLLPSNDTSSFRFYNNGTTRRLD